MQKKKAERARVPTGSRRPLSDWRTTHKLVEGINVSRCSTCSVASEVELGISMHLCINKFTCGNRKQDL